MEFYSFQASRKGKSNQIKTKNCHFLKITLNIQFSYDLAIPLLFTQVKVKLMFTQESVYKYL